MKKFIQSWFINTLAVLIAVYVIKEIHYEKPLDLFAASLCLGILNAVLRPVIMFLTLPILILTLGLFTLVINALLLYFVGYVLRPHFYVENFWSAFLGALIISVVSMILSMVTGTGKAAVKIERRCGRDSDKNGGGPVIDV